MLFNRYDLQSFIRDAFEVRNLSGLINSHSQCANSDPNYVTDISSSVNFRNLKQEFLPGDNDVFLIWNTDGLPIANSSNGQVWLVQVQVVNIPPENRRNFQFVTGVYYSSEKQPNMTSFLWPFVNTLKNLYENTVEWLDKCNNEVRRSRVLAPIATLDAPARAATQNLMKFNGECGCTFCEHKGETCATGKGFNRVYISLQRMSYRG